MTLVNLGVRTGINQRMVYKLARRDIRRPSGPSHHLKLGHFALDWLVLEHRKPTEAVVDWLGCWLPVEEHLTSLPGK